MGTHPGSAGAASGLGMCCLATGGPKIACQYRQCGLAPFMYRCLQAATLPPARPLLFVSVQTLPRAVLSPRLGNVVADSQMSARHFNPLLLLLPLLAASSLTPDSFECRPCCQDGVPRCEAGPARASCHLPFGCGTESARGGRGGRRHGPALQSCAAIAPNHPGDVCEFSRN